MSGSRKEEFTVKGVIGQSFRARFWLVNNPPPQELTVYWPFQRSKRRR